MNAPADVILVNGTVITVDANDRIAEAVAAKQEEKRVKGWDKGVPVVAPDEEYFRREHGVG